MRQVDIAEDVIARFKKLQERKVKKGKRSKTVHVSHITGECDRRPWYDFRNDPEPLSYNSITNFWMGTVLHENATLGKRNEIHLAANIRKMEKVEVKDIGIYNIYDCVTGTADDLLEYEGDVVIADKKTFSTVDSRGNKHDPPTKPDQGYVTQLNIYKLLLYISEGVEAKYGALLYLDKSQSFRDPIAFVFELDSVENIKKKVITKLDHIKQTIPPDRVITKYCNYCPHKKVCAPPPSLIPRWTS